MTGMKVDEEFVPDRRIEVETDDEENEAEIDCDDDDDDETGSDCELPPSSQSHNCTNDPWPQTYRRSMDMYTMPLHSATSSRGTSDLNLPMKRSFAADVRKPLITAKSLGKDHHVPISTTLPMKLSQTTSNLTVSGLPPPVEQCTFSQAVLNAINVLCGIGILSMPYAFKQGGWLSLVLLMVFGVITCYTGILLKICLERCQGLQTYPDIGQAAFGYFGRVCIAMVLYLDLFSSCVEYLIMMNDNLSALFPHAHLDIGGIIHLDSYLFCAIVSTLVILPTVWLRNLSLLSYISVGGVVTLAAVVVCLLWLGVVDGVEYHPSRTALDFGNLPVAVGLIGFCYGSHSVFPNIYTSMQEPSRFPSALLIRRGLDFYKFLDSYFLWFLFLYIIFAFKVSESPWKWFHNISFRVKNQLLRPHVCFTLELDEVPMTIMRNSLAFLLMDAVLSYGFLSLSSSSFSKPSFFQNLLLLFFIRSFSVSFVMYTAVGVYGYLMFGDSVKSQFTLNMPTNHVTSKVAAWTVVVAPVTKFALTLTPITFGIEELLPPAQQNSYGVSIIIRTALMILILLVALTVPYFGVVMALTGSVLEMLVSIIFPCACYLRLLHGHTTTLEITMCSLMICLGLVCAIIGTYTSLASIPG